MGNDLDRSNRITAPPRGKSHRGPCPQAHIHHEQQHTGGRTQPSPPTRPRQDGGRVNRADGENKPPWTTKANASRKRGAYETCLVCLTLGWHQRLPAKHAPAMAVWFLSSPGALQPPHVDRVSLVHCSTPKKGGLLPSFPLLPLRQT